MTPQPHHHRAPDEPRLLRIVHASDVEEAESRLWRGIVSALLIELVLFGGVLIGAIAVAWWPGGS